jgi:hypothetical protein
MNSLTIFNVFGLLTWLKIFWNGTTQEKLYSSKIMRIVAIVLMIEVSHRVARIYYISQIEHSETAVSWLIATFMN